MSERNVVLVVSTPVVRIASPVRLQLCCSQRRFCSLAEEADQSLDVLRSRCHEELLANELHSTQAQATQSDLILQFREQRFHLFSWCLQWQSRVNFRTGTVRDRAARRIVEEVAVADVLV